MYKTAVIKNETDDKIMKLCKEEYLKHNPNMKYIKFSRDMMINIIADHYLRSP